MRLPWLNELLLFWANRDSYSIPVGSNASRILAEAALLEVDNYLLSIGAKFCRFVDDYRLFAPNAHTAHYWLTLLIERLWAEGLTINQRKTKIEDVSNISKNIEEESDVEKVINPHMKEEAKTKDFEPQFRLLAGYGGRIPTRFRALNDSELSKFKDNDAMILYKNIKAKKLTEPDDLKNFVKTVISTKSYSLFENLPELTDLFPQFTPYIVDVLIKHCSEITSSSKEKIRLYFAKRLNSRKYLPEYITIAIVKILGHKDFQSKDVLFEYFRELKRNAGALIGRSLLDSLEDLVSRNEVLEIRKYFTRADSWEKRQIVRIVDKHLNEEEKRPWLKNIKTQEAKDLFLVEYINPSKNKK